MYLTHDSDFVASRVNSKIYWIEKYDGSKWEWRQLQENKDLPQALMIELVGSREPILVNANIKVSRLVEKRS